MCIVRTCCGALRSGTSPLRNILEDTQVITAARNGRLGMQNTLLLSYITHRDSISLMLYKTCITALRVVRPVSAAIPIGLLSLPQRFASSSRDKKAMDDNNADKERRNSDVSSSSTGDNSAEPPRAALPSECVDEGEGATTADTSQSAPGSTAAASNKKWAMRVSSPRIVPAAIKKSTGGPVGGAARVSALRRGIGTPIPSPKIRSKNEQTAAEVTEALSSDEEELVHDVKEFQEATQELHLPMEVSAVPGKKKKFAIIFCEDDPAWSVELPRIWTRLLRQPGEDWVLFRLAEKGELPELTEEDDWDGFLIPGSGHSAYEDLPWIHRLKDLIRQCFIPYLSDHNAEEHRLKPQIVGSCFGAQVIAEALGGHVTKNPRGKYCVKAEEIYIQESFVRQPFAEGIIFKTSYGPRFQPKARKWKAHDESDALPFLRVTQTHGDSVLTLPADSQVLGASKTITNEIFMVGKNMLAYQSHPEFTYRKHLMKRILPYVLPERMDPADLEAAKKSFTQELHSHALIEVTRRFLKREYRDTYDMYHSGSLSETFVHETPASTTEREPSMIPLPESANMQPIQAQDLK